MSKDRTVLPIVFNSIKTRNKNLNKTKSFVNLDIPGQKKSSTVHFKPDSFSLIKLQPCKSLLKFNNTQKLKKYASTSIMEKLAINRMRIRNPEDTLKTPRFVKKKFVFKI